MTLVTEVKEKNEIMSLMVEVSLARETNTKNIDDITLIKKNSDLEEKNTKLEEDNKKLQRYSI